MYTCMYVHVYILYICMYIYIYYIIHMYIYIYVYYTYVYCTYVYTCRTYSQTSTHCSMISKTHCSMICKRNSQAQSHKEASLIHKASQARLRWQCEKMWQDATSQSEGYLATAGSCVSLLHSHSSYYIYIYTYLLSRLLSSSRFLSRLTWQIERFGFRLRREVDAKVKSCSIGTASEVQWSHCETICQHAVGHSELDMQGLRKAKRKICWARSLSARWKWGRHKAENSTGSVRQWEKPKLWERFEGAILCLKSEHPQFSRKPLANRGHESTLNWPKAKKVSKYKKVSQIQDKWRPSTKHRKRTMWCSLASPQRDKKWHQTGTTTNSASINSPKN